MAYCSDIWTQTRFLAFYTCAWLLNVRFKLLFMSLSWLMIRVCLLMVISGVLASLNQCWQLYAAEHSISANSLNYLRAQQDNNSHQDTSFYGTVDIFHSQSVILGCIQSYFKISLTASLVQVWYPCTISCSVGLLDVLMASRCSAVRCSIYNQLQCCIRAWTGRTYCAECWYYSSLQFHRQNYWYI